MKKFCKFFGIAAVLLCGLFLGGCSEDDVNALSGPENTWCVMPVEYKNDESATSVTLYVWCYYTDYEIKGDGTNTGMRADITLPAGITMVVTSKADVGNIITGLNTNTYIMKSFPKDSNVNPDEGDVSYSFNGSKAKWTALYWGKSDLRKPGNQQTGVLDCLKTSSSYSSLTDWESIKNSFSWKRLLATYLLNNLE
ncbi:hypothetical protein [uncultured Treponema sp.]|uniref:hypothetical protein n=1 Tax=uncultured Treponema sp. TaxID=162155 RepID=UPI0015BBF529|nr:hypothetical protein [uncultured Treponema sp.]